MKAVLNALAAAGLPGVIGIACVDMDSLSISMRRVRARRGRAHPNAESDKGRCELHLTSPYQRQRFVFARSMTSSARPPITALTLQSVKPFARTSVIPDGIASSFP